MKNILLTLILSILLCVNLQAQKKVKVYNPEIDAHEVLQKALDKAKTEHKHVFIQIGGNWCSWCLLMHKFYHENKTVDSLLNADYVPIVINYSRENKNLDIMKQFEYPQRFGFPVIVILDENGRRLHTQNTAYLEEGRGYSEEKFTAFLKAWNVAAFNPEQYK